MAKSTRALAGMAKDAYFARLVASLEGLDDATRSLLIARLSNEVALISLRHRIHSPALAPTGAHTEPVQAPVREAPEGDATATPSRSDFDPYSPNVIVVIRTRGREAVLEELHSIDDVDRLRLLAREQQLGLAPDLNDPADIRLAIVAAAERRIANRRAAAG